MIFNAAPFGGCLFGETFPVHVHTLLRCHEVDLTDGETSDPLHIRQQPNLFHFSLLRELIQVSEKI